MNLSALPELLLNWLKGQGAGVVQGARGQEASAPFKAGQQYVGLVLSSLPNGRSLVRVDQQVLDMALPGKQARAGDTVRMTFVSPGPRPTFLINPEGSAGAPQPVRLSEAAQQVSALVRYAQGLEPAATPGAQAAAMSTPGPATHPSVSVQAPGAAQQPAAPPQASPPLSATSTAAQATPSYGNQTAAASSPAGQRPIVPNTSLLLNMASGPSTLTAAIASRTAIPGLGLAGQAVEEIRATLASGTPLHTQGVAQAAQASTHALTMRLRQVVRESGLFYESHLARWVKGEMTQEAVMREPQARLSRSDLPATGMPELCDMSDEAARLAGRQLMMLEGGPLVWQGQVWPGQAMEWLVEQRQSEGGGDKESPEWHTELRLTLPRLGRVDAALGISARGLQINIKSASQEAVDEIRAALPSLAERLAAANLNLLGLSARAHDEHATAP